MEEKKGIKTKTVLLKEYRSDEVGLLTQAVLTEMLIIFSILIMLSDKFMPTFYAIVAMLMFNLAYNNEKFYKRKYLSTIYLLLGLFVTITTIVEYCL